MMCCIEAHFLPSEMVSSSWTCVLAAWVLVPIVSLVDTGAMSFFGGPCAHWEELSFSLIRLEVMALGIGIEREWYGPGVPHALVIAVYGCKIVDIYVHLDRGDSDGLFGRAISNDGRSYREEV